MEDDLKNPKPEPQKFEGRFLKLGIDFETTEHIHWRIENEHYIKFNSIPQAKRQEIIDTFMAGGITIAQVGEKLGISSEVVGSVIFLNIEQCSYMPSHSK